MAVQMRRCLRIGRAWPTADTQWLCRCVYDCGLAQHGLLLTCDSCADASVTVDWLSVACRRPEAFKLEACSEVVPLLEPLLGSPHDKYVLVALGALQMLLQAFGQVIAAACSQPPSSVGVDLSFEERQKRCVVAQSSLLTLSPLLQQLCRQPHEIGVQAMQAYESLSQLA